MKRKNHSNKAFFPSLTVIKSVSNTVFKMNSDTSVAFQNPNVYMYMVYLLIQHCYNKAISANLQF